MNILDTRGLRCPLPVIKAEAKLRKMQVGEQLKVIADDPLAAVDIPHFCQEAGHHVVEEDSAEEICVFLVTAGGKIE